MVYSSLCFWYWLEKNLGTYYYFEDDFFESIEPIIHDMIAFGNNAKECLENGKSILKC